jgi:hypothetical protein
MRNIGWCSIGIMMIFLQGCSTRMWYDGFKMAQANECSKLQDKERERCLQDAGVSYDQYQRERQDILKKE